MASWQADSAHHDDESIWVESAKNGDRDVFADKRMDLEKAIASLPERAGPESSSQMQAAWGSGLTGILSASEREYQAAIREFISVGVFQEGLPQQARYR